MSGEVAELKAQLTQSAQFGAQLLENSTKVLIITFSH